MGVSLGVSTGRGISPYPYTVYEEPLQLGRREAYLMLPMW